MRTSEIIKRLKTLSHGDSLVIGETVWTRFDSEYKISPNGLQGDYDTDCSWIDATEVTDVLTEPSYEVPNAFDVGDGASYCIGGDAYPMTVRRVTSTGKTLWASKDKFRAAAGNEYAQSNKTGIFLPSDTHPANWEKYTLRQDGSWRPVGSKAGYLSQGRSFRRDPSF